MPQNCFDINAPANYHCALMPQSLPHRLDVARLAARDMRLDASFAVRDCPRLVEALVDDSGTVTTRFASSLDDAGRVMIRGEADATVAMRCQRCLEPVTVGLRAAFDLAVVADEDEAAALTSGLEPLISADGQLDPRAMVEDELILALPLVALHDDEAACRPPAKLEGPQGEQESPFAVLKQLKTKQEP